MEWQVENEATRSYRFKYDKLSRITHAAYNGAVSGGMYNSSYAYDKHGNISTLTRRGKNAVTGSGNVVIDQLKMTYSGNQMIHVSDGIANFAYSASADFKDKVSTAGTLEYTYDRNGAMKSDLNKGITEIKYNLLNLPQAIEIDNQGIQGRVKYAYSASGIKLRTIHETDRNGQTASIMASAPFSTEVTDIKTTDYAGNIIYEVSDSQVGNTAKTRILVDGGYIEDGSYHYYMTDHLGNNRVVFGANGTIIQKNHYYPFGTAFAENTTAEQGKQPYMYNGKELDTRNGLNMYDYGARYYESSIGRFTTVDPMAEEFYSWSPYAYCGNNPVNRIDPDGREWKETKDEEIAKQLQQQVANRDKALTKQEAKINAKINEIGNNTKLSAEKKTQQIVKQQGKLENVQAQKTILSNLNEGITQLGNSETVYTFNTVGQGTTATLSSITDGTVVINNYGTVGNRAHETTHAIQYDNGKIKFNPLGSDNTIMQNPLGLEIQAYATEFSITNGIVPSSNARNPRTVFGINTQWLYGIKDPNTGIYIYRPANYHK